MFIIETTDLTKHYGRFEAVRALNLRVASGKVTGFLGRNGAGKSTTIKMLLGMVHPTAGSGAILGRRITDPRQNRDMRRHVAYVGEDKPLYSYLTVEQLIRFTKSFYPDWRRDLEQRLLKQYQLPLHRKVRALSKGMRTKLALLLALARRPELLILDEPSEGLDPVSIEELLSEIAGARSEGISVFFSSHQIAEVERISDDVCIMDSGTLAMSLSLSTLQREGRRIRLTFDKQAPPVEFDIHGIQHIRTSSHEMTVLANSNTETIAELARCWGGTVREIAPVSLREIFLERVKDAI